MTRCKDKIIELMKDGYFLGLVSGVGLFLMLFGTFELSIAYSPQMNEGVDITKASASFMFASGLVLSGLVLYLMPSKQKN